MKKKILCVSIVLGVFLLLMPGFAQTYTTKRCFDNSTLQVNNTYFVDIGGGSITNFTIFKNINCVYGCADDTKDCNPSPLETDIIAIVGLAGFILLIILVLKAVKIL